METVEILAGGEFNNAVICLGLTSAKCTYHYQPHPKSKREDYQVWMLSKEDFDNLCSIDGSEWMDSWGWFDYALGSDIDESKLVEYMIHGHKIKVLREAMKSPFCENEYEYKDIIEYCNAGLLVFTNNTICYLCSCFAKSNGITLSDLFKKYLG